MKIKWKPDPIDTIWKDQGIDMDTSILNIKCVRAE